MKVDIYKILSLIKRKTLQLLAKSKTHKDEGLSLSKSTIKRNVQPTSKERKKNLKAVCITFLHSCLAYQCFLEAPDGSPMETIETLPNKPDRAHYAEYVSY